MIASARGQNHRTFDEVNDEKRTLEVASFLREFSLAINLVGCHYQNNTSMLLKQIKLITIIRLQ